MQALQQELWPLEGPDVLTHVGDLAWWATMHVGREHERKRRLWLDDGRCVAWGWLNLPGSLDYDVHPDHRAGRVHEEVLHWFESEAEEGGALSTFVLESDDDRLPALEALGFRLTDDAMWYAYYVQELDEPRTRPKLPDGFTCRTVDPRNDLHERVEVHRAVWEPSRVTEESYRQVMQVWPYRADLDCVIEAPDGRFAAYVLCWYDEQNAVGEFEPVGTHPDYRRRGLGAAACEYALERLREEGARHAIVYAGGRDQDRPARSLYESVGFRQHSRAVQLRRER